jgi:hypothetical protein
MAPDDFNPDLPDDPLTLDGALLQVLSQLLGIRLSGIWNVRILEGELDGHPARLSLPPLPPWRL